MKNHSILRLFLTILTLAAIVTAASGCITERPGVDAPPDIIHFPIGVAVHPAGRYAAVVNANFNQAYRNGSVVVVDLSTYRIVPEWTLPIGSFGGEVAFNHAGTRLFVTTRGPFFEQDGITEEPADLLLAIDVDARVAAAPKGDEPFFIADTRQAFGVAPNPFGVVVDANDRYVYVTHISDGEMTVLEDDLARFVEPADDLRRESGEVIRRCLPENLSCPSGAAAGALCGACDANLDCGTTEFVVAGDGGGLPREEANTCLSDPRRIDSNYCATYCEVDETVLNEDGEVVRQGCPSGYRCEVVRPIRMIAQRKFSRGGNQAVISPLTGSVYVSHRDSNLLGVLRPYYTSGLGYQARVEQILLMEGVDTRGMAFNADGSRLYVAARNLIVEKADLPGIMVLDTTLGYETCGKDQTVGDSTSCERNEQVDFIELAPEPANVAIYKDMLYVPIYDTDEIYVIDLTLRQVVDVIDVAPEAFIQEPGIFRQEAKPYDIAIYENQGGVWGLVSNFEAHEVAVLRLFDENGEPINKVDRKIENRAKLYSEDQY